MYTNEQLTDDMWTYFNLFKGLFEQKLNNIWNTILDDNWTPKRNWKTPYKELIELSKQARRDTTVLEQALKKTDESIIELNHLMTKEILELSQSVNKYAPD